MLKKIAIGSVVLLVVSVVSVFAWAAATAAPDTQFALRLRCMHYLPKNMVEAVLDQAHEAKGDDLFYVFRKSDDGVTYWDGYRRYHDFTVHFKNGLMSGFEETYDRGMPQIGPGGRI